VPDRSRGTERTFGHDERMITKRVSSGSEMGTRENITKKTTLKYLARWALQLGPLLSLRLFLCLTPPSKSGKNTGRPSN
jgi:hypothetical protein